MIRDKIREVLLIIFFLGACFGLLFIFGAGIICLSGLGWWVPVVVLTSIVTCVFGFWLFKLSAF